MTLEKFVVVSNENKKEIFYNVVNAGLAGMLVFLGSLTGGFSAAGLAAGIIASLVVAVTKFKDYWALEQSEYCSRKNFFNFI